MFTGCLLSLVAGATCKVSSSVLMVDAAIEAEAVSCGDTEGVVTGKHPNRIKAKITIVKRFLFFMAPILIFFPNARFQFESIVKFYLPLLVFPQQQKPFFALLFNQ
jgi:hypothetical protein